MSSQSPYSLDRTEDRMRTLAGLCLALLVAISAAAPGSAQSAATLHDGLEKARADRAGDPEAVAAFGRLAKEFGTPLYVYDRATILGQYARVRDAFRATFPRLKIFF